jgi:hypothetical protein
LQEIRTYVWIFKVILKHAHKAFRIQVDVWFSL